MRAARTGALIAIAAAGVAALAGDKGGSYTVRLTEEGGAVVQGHATFKKDGIELAAPSGTRRIPYRLVKAIEEVDPDAPPPESDRPKDKAIYDEKVRQAEKKPGDDARSQGHQWAALGEWAKKHGLEDEAKKAFEKAVELYSEELDARRGLGQAKDADGTWGDVKAVMGKKLQALPATADANARYALGRELARAGLDEPAFSVVDPLNAKDPFNKALLAYLRPITDRRKQATRLGFPLRGVWRASQDPSHHHEAKTYAVYAIDFYREKDGKLWANDGKKLEDHYAWGQPVYAVADGLVIGVNNDFPDNEIGKFPPGDLQMKNNNVCVVHSGTETSWYLHLKKGSARVKAGDRVKRGQVLGEVGNSGASGAPHLHYTLVDHHRLSIPWRCDDWDLVIEDGSKIHMKHARVLEGQLCEADE